MNNYQKYIDNIKEFNRLENLNYSGHDIIDNIKSISYEKKRIKDENDLFLKELKLYEDKQEINESEYTNLKNFSKGLFSLNNELDIPIAKRIQLILLKHSEQTDNIEEIINNCFNLGVSEYYLMNSLNDYNNLYFDKVLKYKDRFDDLSIEAKQDLIKAYGNYLTLSKRKSADEIIKNGLDMIAFFQKYQDVIDDLDKYLLIAHLNICSAIYCFLNGEGINRLNTLIVYESSVKVINMAQIASKTTNPFLVNYYFTMYVAMYYNNMMSLKELIDNLSFLSMPRENEDVNETMIRVFKIGAYYLKFLSMQDLLLEEKAKLINEKIAYILEYANNLIIKTDSEYIDNAILSFINVVDEICTYEEIKDIIFHVTMHRHKPTYIHTITVSMIVEAIGSKILKHNKEYFKNCFETEITSSDEILKRLKEMSLMHDVGKYGCMKCIQNSSRALTDDEFLLIKNHPQFGYHLFPRTIPKYVVDGVLYHHLWYNHNGGYPLGLEKTNNQPLIDILSIADSIDAATDYIGRPYSKGKSLNELIQEFKHFSGTRYSPYIVDLLDDKDLFDKINQIITEKRDDLIIKVYNTTQN